MMISARKVLWVDCTAAAFAGVAVLVLSGWMSRLHLLPHGLLLFIGGVNLLYGSYTFALARRTERSMFLIKLLVFANAAWAIVCLGLAGMFWNRASVFGLMHLVGEALFVGGLAAMEWKRRHELSAGPTTAGRSATWA